MDSGQSGPNMAFFFHDRFEGVPAKLSVDSTGQKAVVQIDSEEVPNVIKGIRESNLLWGLTDEVAGEWLPVIREQLQPLKGQTVRPDQVFTFHASH